MNSALQVYLANFRQHYPSFQSFSLEDEAFDRAERHYKLALVDLFHEAVAKQLENFPDTLAAQTALGQAITRLLTTPLAECGNRPQNLVHYRYVSAVTFAEEDNARWAKLTQELLYGKAAIGERIDLFVSGLRELVRRHNPDDKVVAFNALSRSVTSFLLMLSNPDCYGVVKTKETNRALKAFGLAPFSNGPLTGDEYQRVQAFFQEVRRELTELGMPPRDMIDVQSFLWVGDGLTYDIKNELCDYWLLPPGTDTWTPNKSARWENTAGDQFVKSIQAIRPGDQVALVSNKPRSDGLPSGTTDRPAPCLHIHARGTVLENPGNGEYLDVDWDAEFTPRTIDSFLPAAPVSVLSPELDAKVIARIFGEKDPEVAQIAAIQALTRGIVPVNQIFYGPPGTGKTFATIEESVRILDPDFLSANQFDRATIKLRFDQLKSEGRIAFVTFHQSFSYEDFVEGLRATADDQGQLRYEVADGIFKTFCTSSDPSRPNVLIIDEINRGNLSRIFGELITLIEPDKRVGAREALTVVLPYSKTIFGVPRQLHLIGTMNTADRSLAGLDVALRRRFRFIWRGPDVSCLEGIAVEGIGIAELFETLNERIAYLLDDDHCLGHGYFLPLRENPTLPMLKAIFESQIIPLLEEYFFDDWERLRWVLNDHRKTDETARFIVPPRRQEVDLFGPEVAERIPVHRWIRNKEALDNLESYRGIVQ